MGRAVVTGMAAKVIEIGRHHNAKRLHWKIGGMRRKDGPERQRVVLSRS
jgi:hypothetical protein